ncbi:hypothetical protein [Streptomyces anulatus]|uniref:hypothetical protein n=1 Tax=Streptomyces anulatus TaxID=1892 RepID=UPI0034342D57
MHTSDLVAQVTSIVVASTGMVIAWLSMRCRPCRDDPPLPPPSGNDAERPS